MGMESSAHDDGAAVGIDGKKVSWGPTPSPRGERIEETARVGGRIARLCQSRLQAIANLCLSTLNQSYQRAEGGGVTIQTTSRA